MRFKPIFYFLLLCLGCHLSQAETTSPSPTFPLIPLIPASNSARDIPLIKISSNNPPLDFDQLVELRKIAAYTDGLKKLYEIYNTSDYMEIYNNDNYDPTQPIGKNFKKAMDASRKCGMILNEGLKYSELRDDFSRNHQENEELTTYVKVSNKLLQTFGKISTTASSAFFACHQDVYSANFENIYSRKFEPTSNAFNGILEHYGNEQAFVYFKETCQPSWNYGFFEPTLANFFEDNVKSKNYIDRVYVSCHKFYKLVLEFDMATYPMCRIYKKGIPSNQDASDRAQEFMNHLQLVNKKFKELNYKRQEYFWSTENIVRIVKTYILGENMTDFSGDNSKIAKNIHKDLDENYKSLGYIYHVSVSAKTGRNGYNDTLLQCSTECKYIYNINGKDVYIIRNKKGQAYKECKFLPTSSLTYCGSDRDLRDLQELAKQIQANCNPTAFSLIRSARENRYSNYYPEKNQTPAFTQKCFGDISLTMANNY